MLLDLLGVAALLATVPEAFTNRAGRSIADTANLHPHDGADALARAAEGFDLVLSDPARAEVLLRAVVHDTDPATSHPHADAVVLAHRGLGRLLHERGDVGAASDAFRDGHRIAERFGRHRHRALLEMSWSASLQALGNTVEALDLLTRAERDLTGADLGLLVMQRGVVHWFAGQLDDAVRAYDRALPTLERSGDHLALTRLLGNRGIAAAQLGALRAARADVRRQLDLATAHGQTQVAATALHNLGWLEGRLGNVPAALRLLGQARGAYEVLGRVDRVATALDTDECEVLLQANLAVEADELAQRVVATAAATGNVTQLAEATLMRARAQLAMGRPDRARDGANEAAELFRASGRPAWGAMADYIGEQAALAAPELGRPPDASEVHRLRGIASELHAAGWVIEAAEVRVHAGRAALRAGLLGPAREELQRAARARERAVAAVRAEAWHATALLRLADGDRRGARRAIEAGLRALDRHRATLGAIELRAHASAHGVELGQLGLRLAVEERGAANVLVWAERWRAGALGLPVPTAVAESDLAALRELHAAERGTDAERTAETASRIAAAERGVTAKARVVPGDPRSVATRIDVRALRSALGERSLVEYVQLDGQLHAVVVTAERCRLVPLGPAAAVSDAHDHLVFALRRLSMLPPGHPALAGATSALETAAAEVDALLLAALRLRPGPIVVVPTGHLHRVAWSALPTLAGRAVTIAPSAGWWLGQGPPTGLEAGATAGQVLLVEGPDLEGSAAEMAALGDLLPGATTLTGHAATAANVLAAFGDADVAHVAAHGAFRGDNPLFSSLRLADGPIWVHDLAALGRAPRLVILTACEAGRSGVLAGDELLGTATALLSLGVQTVIAPLLPVPDAATARFAIRLHHHLARGATPAEACAWTAADERDGGDPTGLAVASTFHCIGNRGGDRRNP